MPSHSKWITCAFLKAASEKDKPFTDYLWAVLFFLVTVYLFIGIAISSDIFMNSIEKICSFTRTIKETREEDGVVVETTREVLVWNETVANLTLMALGSSAPEILLSVIETVEGLGSQDSGDLGPGTIVGSGAFNLMMISAICILSLKNGATSRIKLYNVFIVTCITSVFAYVWMVVVLQWNTPDQVDLWEGIITLIYSPALVLIAYMTDQNCFIGGGRRESVASVGSAGRDRDFFFGDADQDNLYDEDGNVDREALQNLYYKLVDYANLTPEEIGTILATKLVESKPRSKNWYRTKAFRVLLGAGSMKPALDEKLMDVVNVIGSTRESGIAGLTATLLRGAVTSPETYQRKAVVEFQAAALAVREGIGSFPIAINRSGKEDIGFKCQVFSLDGTAKAGVQYVAVNESLTFEPQVNEQTINVKIIDNSEWNPDSNFYLKLEVAEELDNTVVVGKMHVIEIIIEDDDKPGKLSFVKMGYLFKHYQKVVYVEVERTDGSDGTVYVTWKINPGPKCTLVPEGMEGKLEFNVGEKKKAIELRLNPHEGPAEGSEETFEIELVNPEGGAKLGKIPKTTCAVTSDESFKLHINNVITAAIQQSEEDDEEVSYKDQIIQSFYPNDGDYANATYTQWALHIIVFPMKFVLSLIPPPHIAQGWVCFIFSLIATGLLTKTVGESAGCLGKGLGLQPIITAITFCALGTSLPDTFASMISARNDKTADNAIGNITGSNSVNVFLGLGLPWTIGAIYYRFKNKGSEPFCVPAKSLTFNVVLFSICAAATIGLLVFRRFSASCGKAELGGPKMTKWITALTMMGLWGFYILLSAIQVDYPHLGLDDPFVGSAKSVTTVCEKIVEHARSTETHK